MSSSRDLDIDILKYTKQAFKEIIDAQIPNFSRIKNYIANIINLINSREINQFKRNYEKIYKRKVSKK